MKASPLACFALLLFLLLAGRSAATVATQTIDLAGAGWMIALDPTDGGESRTWHEPAPDWKGTAAHPRAGWDEVAVPHDYLTDPRFAYTGVAWYRRSFFVPAETAPDRTCRLQFDSVFQRCRVWLNGRLVGTHEGGYTPFEFSAANFLLPGRHNLLVVAVDNRVRFRALPGARSGTSANSAQYPWLNYGGILGGVRLVLHAPVWIAAPKIETVPEGATWRVSVRLEVRNDTDRPQSGRVAATIPGPAALPLEGRYAVAARAATTVVLTGTVPRDRVVAWDVAHPVMHRCQLQLDGDGHSVTVPFGFRSIAVRDAQFLLNDRPVRLAGANRARGHPVHGGIDPDALVAQDLALLKAAGLVFARIQHTAPGRNFLEQADRLGFLLVLEVGMWGYTSPDQASTELRTRFQEEMRELIRLAQNHPSVVGWSLGNEYESWTPEGVA